MHWISVRFYEMGDILEINLNYLIFLYEIKRSKAQIILEIPWLKQIACSRN